MRGNVQERSFHNCIAGDDGMIRKTSGRYKVLSEKGKNLGRPYKTKAEAEKRLRQVNKG